MTTLALYSNKGGVGKTAAAVNLAYLAARSGKPTLICDLDPQGATSYYLRVKPRVKRQARGLAKPGPAIEDSIKGTGYENLDLLPSDFTHRNLDIGFDKLKSPGSGCEWYWRRWQSNTISSFSTAHRRSTFWLKTSSPLPTTF
jgi:chromosome partitioning protein